MVLSRSFWWLRRCLLRSSSGLDKDEIASEIEKLEEVDHEMSSIPWIIFVALLWMYSNRSTSLLY